jgi:hypothetical protein
VPTGTSAMPRTITAARGESYKRHQAYVMMDPALCDKTN